MMYAIKRDLIYTRIMENLQPKKSLNERLEIYEIYIVAVFKMDYSEIKVIFVIKRDLLGSIIIVASRGKVCNQKVSSGFLMYHAKMRVTIMR